MTEQEISCCFLVPTAWARVEQVAASSAAATPKAMRAAVVGGSPCAPALRSALIKRGVPLWIGYGMTETAPMLTLLPPDADDAQGCVGAPGPSVEIAIEAPDAEGIGRVCVLATNLMSGYWRRPDATRRTLDADGWLHTEDLGWIDTRGQLHLVGRADDAILSGGYKIHPAEVELALDAIPHIQDLAIIATPHPTWGQLVTLIAVPDDPDAPPSLADIHTHLHERGSLARFKWPRRLAIRNHPLPRSAAGKPLRRAIILHEDEIRDERLPTPHDPND
jgi:acyl-CoA synthetase (AMP-forming)/AMP-acid ligase II